MAGEWRETTVGEFAPFTYGKGLPESQRDSSGKIPVFGSNGIVGYHSKALTVGPTVVIGRKGTAGAVHYSSVACWPIDTTFYIVDDDPLVLRFKYYLLKFLNLEHMNSDSAVPGLNREAAHALKVFVPPLPEQRAIAAVLGALDDKIELNRRMNRTLEAIAQAVFRHWFVENEEAEGWEEKPLDEIADFLNGLALQKFPPKEDEGYLPVIKIAQLRKNDTDGADKASVNIPPEYIVKDGDILFSWSGSLEVVAWCGGKGALNQHLFKVTSKKYPKWFYYYWIKHHLPDFQKIAAGKATTMGHIQRHHLKEAMVLVPSDKELREMDKIMSPLLEKIILNEQQSRTLAALRDALLPKLMRGEVRVTVHE
jgi:type I restriction enzyme S subunit